MHSFSAYTIKVFDSLLLGPKADRYHVLDKVRSKNMLDYFEVFVKTLQGIVHVDAKGKRTISVDTYARTSDSLYGWIEYGEYGLPGKMVNVKTKQHTYSKTHEDSDVVRLYFQLRIPSGKKIGYALFHTAGNRGVKQAFYEKFNEYFRRITSGLVVQLNPISHEQTLKEWIDNSQVKEIRIAKVNIERGGVDITDKLGAGFHTEFTIKAGKGMDFGPFGKFGERKTDDGDNFVEVLKDISPDIKAVISSGGRKKVISITGGNPIAAIDITEDNVAILNGVPDEGQLHKYANILIGEFISKG